MEEKKTRCEQCKHYAPLAMPFHYEKLGYPVGVTVYGFCTKNAAQRSSFYPVYIPDGGVCTDYAKKSQRGKKPDSPIEGQMKLEV